ncbi:MAG: hypothetical protein COA37_19210 [Hoeflea sp.]|uniref:hypothetical protein n=1 Tax=Hoeflea sp. TaxID=1940281 RepID=UPI000C10E180|nr:hypothetical protein [Hoeflea sp.]PHR18699.1 MAG: hypothetical protein COA37_19210 [Hoeflea sp.]
MNAPKLNVTFSDGFDSHQGEFSLTSADPSADPSSYDFSSSGVANYAQQAWEMWFSLMPVSFYANEATIEVHFEYLAVDPFPGFVAMVDVGSLSPPQYSGNVTRTFHELVSGEDSNGSEPDMVISVGSLLGSRYGGITSVLAHEFGHSLGLSLQETNSVFGQLVKDSFFIGESAISENGGPVPVADDGHIVNPAKSVMGGNSIWPTALDIAILKDIGLFKPFSGTPSAIQQLFSDATDTAKGLSAAYSLLQGGVPNEAGFTALINSAKSTNFGAGAGPVFNSENIFINLANNLVQGNTSAKATFDTLATGGTLAEKIASLYQSIIPLSAQTADGLAYLIRPEGITFYEQIAAERGIAGTDGAAIIAMASLLKIAVSQDIGIGNAVNDLIKAVAAGSAMLPAAGSVLTDIETADGTQFDGDDGAAGTMARAASEEFFYTDDVSATVGATMHVDLVGTVSTQPHDLV